jgi:hypothetical protein
MFLRKNFFGWISAYLNGIKSVCLYKDIIFSISYDTGELILLFLWSDTWLVSGNSRSAWRWVMQFLPGAGKGQLRSGLSVNALYNCSLLTVTHSCCFELLFKSIKNNSFNFTQTYHSYYFIVNKITTKSHIFIQLGFLKLVCILLCSL